MVYSLTKDPSLQTRHLVVYNTGPAVGVDLETLRRVFEAYGTVERLECPNLAWSRVYISFEKVTDVWGIAARPAVILSHPSNMIF